MTSHAYIHHYVPGRIRLKIPSRRNDAPFFRDVEQKVEEYQGVLRSRGNSQTGSLLIEYASPFKEIANRAEADDLFQVTRDALAPVVANETPETLARVVSRASTSAAPRPELMPALAVGFAGLGAYQLFRGQVLAPATTLLWYALSARILSRQPAAERTKAVP